MERLGSKSISRKPKEMRTGVRHQESLELHGEAVERVSAFTYLGSIISETGGTDEDLTARIRKAQSTFSMIMPVWKEKCIRLQTKLRIFNTNVKSALLFGSETWRSTKQLIKKLQTFINKCLRKILNICWPEVISNDKLWERTQQIRIEESIMRRKWKWSGIRYGSLRIISPVTLSSGTLRGLEEEVAQSNPGV